MTHVTFALATVVVLAEVSEAAKKMIGFLAIAIGLVWLIIGLIEIADRALNPPRRDPPVFHQLPPPDFRPVDPPAVLAPRMDVLPEVRTPSRVTVEVDRVEVLDLRSPRER